VHLVVNTAEPAHQRSVEHAPLHRNQIPGEHLTEGDFILCRHLRRCTVRRRDPEPYYPPAQRRRSSLNSVSEWPFLVAPDERRSGADYVSRPAQRR
jgi:hypothetical protein